MAIAAAVVLGLPAMRLRGDYLAIVTLGFGEITRILLKSDTLINLTGGPRGILDIHGPTLFGKPFTSDVNYVYLIFAGVALSIFLYNRLQDSRINRLQAMWIMYISSLRVSHYPSFCTTVCRIPVRDGHGWRSRKTQLPPRQQA
jgi:hypothetical protein